MSRRPTPGSSSNSGSSEQDALLSESAMFLECQNKSLAHAVAENKRLLYEVRLDLETIQSKARMLESLLAGVQRAWSQLVEIELTMLLDDLGSGSDTGAEGSVLGHFMRAGSSLALLDPLNIDPQHILCADKWSSTEEMQADRERVQEALDAVVYEPRVRLDAEGALTVTESSVQSVTYMEQLPAAMPQYAAFATSLLERLCACINEAALFQSTPRVIRSITAAKELYTERFLLTDKITKLSVEIDNTSNKLYRLEQQKTRLTSELGLRLDAASKSGAGAGAGSEGPVVPPTDDAAHMQRDRAYDETALRAQAASHDSLRGRIKALDAQVAESEAAKEKVENALSEMVAGYIQKGDDESSATIKKIFVDFRTESNKSISLLQAELGRLSDKASNLELSLLKSQKAQQPSVDRAALMARSISTLLLKEHNSTRSEIASLQKSISEINRGRSLEQQLQQASRSETALLVSQLREVTSQLDASREILQANRAKELQLVCELSGAAAGAPRTCPRDFQVQAVTDSGALEQYLASVQSELQNANISVKDLSLEIESVLQEEKASREQLSLCLPQALENLQTHRALIEDFIRHGAAIETQRASVTNATKKAEVLTGLVKKQETLKKKVGEVGLRQELAAAQAGAGRAVASSAASTHQERRGDKLLAATKKLQALLKDGGALRASCDELAVRCERLRDARMASYRASAVQSVLTVEAGGDSTGLGVGGSSQDAELLEASLSMLRCSVCKDRFKCVAITRCYHLFCRECIEENLRNRQRKCPACGEKFGADDVRALIY